MSNKVMKPWLPVAAEENENSIKVSVWGRDFVSGKESFLQSIVSQGCELLSSPVRLVGREDEKDFVFSEYRSFLMEREGDSYAEVVCAAESEQFLINVSLKIEFDGFIDTSITVAPRGRTVKQIFGLESLKPFTYTLDKLWLEIPIKREAAKYYQVYPRGENEGPLDASGRINEKKSMPFKAQTFLANDKVGFMFSAESPKNFSPMENEQCCEIIPSGDEVIFRVRLIDEEPKEWQLLNKNDPKERTSLHPLCYRFGIMATPVKPVSKNITEERAVHIDCFKKIPNDYEDFLGNEFENSGEITFDRLQRLGVNTLYIHEKWNDLQNSPLLTTGTEKRLRYIIDECHKRGIRVIPYFGYEISSLTPYFAELLPRVEVVNTRISRWYRQPPQRDSKVCQRSEWSEFFTNGIERLIDKYSFDGIYLDGTAYLWPCMNTLHGCGCTSPNGVKYPTYSVLGTRKTMKRLYEIVCEKRGGTINCHAGSAFNMPALSFATSIWDGETFQSEFINGKVEKLPDDYFKCLYTGKNLGLLIYMLCYLTPPAWSFDMALAVSLPFGIIPKVNDAGEPLEVISKIWKIYDDFGVSTADFISFYDEHEKGVSASDPRVKVSVYKRSDEVLAILSVTDKSLALDFTVKSSGSIIKDVFNDKLLSTDGEARISLSGFDFAILEIKNDK